MPLQDLTPPPTPPQRTDPPDTFIQRADAWLRWQENFANEVSTLATQLEATAALIAAAPAYADPGLVALTGKTPAADRVPYFTGTSTSALATLTAAGRALIDDATADAQLDTLGLTANGKALVKAANYAAMRTLLGLVVGTDVQAYDAELAALAGLTSAANKLPYFTGSGTAATADLTAFARTLLDDADAATARATLGAMAVTSQSLGANGYRIFSDGYKETWGTISIGQDSYATYTLPTAHTSWCFPMFCLSARAGNVSYSQNTGISSVDVDGTGKPVSVTFWNAEDATLTIYVETRGV